MNKANYHVLIDTATSLLIKDLGPWDQHSTVTNDIENVIDELFASGKLTDGKRLFAIDSSGQEDEVIIKDRKFSSFIAKPKA